MEGKTFLFFVSLTYEKLKIFYRIMATQGVDMDLCLSDYFKRGVEDTPAEDSFLVIYLVMSRLIVEESD